MKTVLAELLDRFTQTVAANHGQTLLAQPPQTAEVGGRVKTPVWTVVIHGRRNGKEEPLAVILLTTPAAAPDDPALLDFIIRRARANKAPYFVTWTLRDAILWETPKPGTPAARGSLDKLRDYPDLYEIAQSDDAILDEPLKLKILQRGGEILHDLERLLRDEALDLVAIDATYFVGRLLDAVHRLLPLVAESLQVRLQTDHAFRGEIAVWAVRQGIAGDPQDAEFARSIARQIIYRLLGKVLFYQSLRRAARQLPELDLRGVDSAQVLPTLRAAFARALAIDYYAVFAEDLPDRIQWPAQASRELAALIQDFHTRDFSHVPQDVIGAVFEQLIPPEERHGLGQYFTPENLCDLIIGFCVRSPTDHVLDPTCGTGTFLIRAYDRLRWLGQTDHVKLLSQLWGVDIAPFPAELATINLFRQRVAEHGNFPRIICQDVFAVAPGQRFRFPPPKVDFDRPQMVEHDLPRFDAVVGNFPFIRQEKIERLVPGYKRQIEQVIAQGWFDAYPDGFTFRSARLRREFERFRKLNQPCPELRDQAELKLSGKADMLAYLFFHVARFLAPGGRLGVITSNAWLDVDYGHELQQFLLDNFKIIAILESRCEPWFTEADVNTIATIVERCESASDRDAHLVKFVKVKRPLAELIPGDPRTAAMDRWATVRRHADHIERAGWKDRKTRPLGVITEEDNNFRIRVCRQGELRADLEVTQRTAKWGTYLRAPQVYFDLLKSARIPWKTFGELCEVKAGFATRIDEFFYPNAETREQFQIEDRFLLPILESSDDVQMIRVRPVAVAKRVFYCPLSINELKAEGCKGALAYIAWGAKQRTRSGVPWPEGPSVKHRAPGWWALEPRSRCHIYIVRRKFTRLLHLYCEEGVHADDGLYGVYPKAGCDESLVAALMNSSLFLLCEEVIGRAALGGGLLEVMVNDIVHLMPFPDVGAFPAQHKARIVQRFSVILERPVDDVFQEVERSDRKALDSAVLAAIGLRPATFLSALHQGLCELVRERIELGKMRSKARKTKARAERAATKVAEAVLDELLPDGPKRFPDDFFSPAAAAGPKTAVDLPEEPLVFDHTPMFMGVHVKGGSYDRHVRSPAEGKFLLYAQQAGHKHVQVPEKTVEVSRTVANYEKYLRELHARLYEAYYRRTLDTRTAARLTQAAFDRFHLPKPEGV